MKNAALLLSLAGLIFLSLILLFQKPVPVSDYSQLNSLEENTLVSVQGNITNIYSYGKRYQIQLNNDINCLVNSIPKNKTNLRVVGITQKYQNKTNILALELSNDN